MSEALPVPWRPMRVVTAAALMEAARVCALGQITETFFDVGGHHRRNV